MKSSLVIPRVVVDGDTFIDDAGIKYRARWIDAPETRKSNVIPTAVDLNQWKWGELSRSFLYELIHAKQLTVIVHEIDSYNRFISDWYLGRSNVQLQLLRVGLSVAFLDPKIIYESQQLTKLDILLASRILYHQYQAIKSQKGVWTDAQFMMPVEYRKLR